MTHNFCTNDYFIWDQWRVTQLKTVLTFMRITEFTCKLEFWVINQKKLSLILQFNFCTSRYATQYIYNTHVYLQMILFFHFQFALFSVERCF